MRKTKWPFIILLILVIAYLGGPRPSSPDYSTSMPQVPGNSNALEQYQAPVRQLYSDPEKCDERYLLWFHHVSWDHKMKSGRTLWDELCHQYYQGADSAKWMQQQWNTLEGQIDDAQFRFVKSLLNIQQQEAVWWRNACVLYFQTFSKKPIPPGLEKPDKTLQYYEQLEFPFAPGIRPRW